MRKWISIWAVFAMTLHAQPYTLGQGLHIDPMLNIGGYFSSEFESKNNKESVGIDDVAVIAYGDYS